MNFSRALTSLLSSSSSKHRLLRAPIAAIHPHLFFSTKTSQPKKKAAKPPPFPRPVQTDELPVDPILNLKRPTEIPFQPRVANSVHLIGTIGVPVQKELLPDGRVTAVSVLIQEKYVGLPKVWIPVIFQGELAQVAAAYLKENDTVHIIGQLNGDTGPLLNQNQANVQVLAHTLNYVVDSGPNSFKDAKPELDARDAIPELDAPVLVEKKDPVSYAKEKDPVYYAKGGVRKPNMKLWDDVVANPQNWVDNRMDKQNGLLKVKFPDFTNKVTKDALWINAAPSLIVEHLDRLEFANKSVNRGQSFSSRGAQEISNSSYSNRSQTYTRKKEGTGSVSKDALWKDLVDNPRKWWDNRKKKFNPKSPDFKHKDTGEGLWLDNTTPQWALETLPSENANGRSSGTYGGNGTTFDVQAKSYRTTLLS